MSQQPKEKKNGIPERPEEKKPLTPEQKKKRREKLVMALSIVGAAVMVIVAAGAVFMTRWFVKPELPNPPTAESVPPGQGSVPPAESGDPDPMGSLDIDSVQPLVDGARKSEEFYTVLIFGQDVVSGLTDTIMVASYDVTNQKASVMSIPRDTIINSSGKSPAAKQINAVYTRNGEGDKGAEALKREVSRLVGFVPDYHVIINWEIVGQMVDAIGGVSFDIPRRMYYDDPLQDLHIHFEAGVQKLNGEQAMELVRWRKNNDGTGASDLTRLSIQHDFLKAVMAQTLKPQNLLKIDSIVALFEKNVSSDLSIENMLWFARAAVTGGLGVDDVTFLTMPCYGVDNSAAKYYGRVFPSQNQLLKMVNESLNPFVEDVTIRQLDLIRVSADGNTISSSTGVLRDPSAAIPPARPSGSQPVESGPVESGQPVESGPVESGRPVGSDPGNTDPVESDPGNTDPVESGPVTPGPVPVSSDPLPEGPVPIPSEAAAPVPDPPEGGPAEVPEGDGGPEIPGQRAVTIQ